MSNNLEECKLGIEVFNDINEVGFLSLSFGQSAVGLVSFMLSHSLPRSLTSFVSELFELSLGSVEVLLSLCDCFFQLSAFGRSCLEFSIFKSSISLSECTLKFFVFTSRELFVLLLCFSSSCSEVLKLFSSSSLILDVLNLEFQVIYLSLFFMDVIHQGVVFFNSFIISFLFSCRW